MRYFLWNRWSTGWTVSLFHVAAAVCKQVLPPLDNSHTKGLTALYTTKHANLAATLLFQHSERSYREWVRWNVEDVSPRIAQQTGSHHSTHMCRHTRTHSNLPADVHKRESAPYFFVIFLGRWVCVLAGVVSGGPAAGIYLSVVHFILLTGPWSRRVQRAGLRLLNTTLDLHLPLQSLKDVEENSAKLDSWAAHYDHLTPICIINKINILTANLSIILLVLIFKVLWCCCFEDLKQTQIIRHHAFCIAHHLRQ